MTETDKKSESCLARPEVDEIQAWFDSIKDKWAPVLTRLARGAVKDSDYIHQLEENCDAWEKAAYMLRTKIERLQSRMAAQAGNIETLEIRLNEARACGFTWVPKDEFDAMKLRAETAEADLQKAFEAGRIESRTDMGRARMYAYATFADWQKSREGSDPIETTTPTTYKSMRGDGE